MKPKNKKIVSFTDLIAWQKGHKLVLDIYKITEKFPQKETYSLIDQMRRAVVSITSNLAEGFGRQTYKDKIHFYYLSQGSLIELKNQLLIAKDIKYFKLTTKFIDQVNEVHKLVQGLITASKKRA